MQPNQSYIGFTLSAVDVIVLLTGLVGVDV